MPPFFLLCSTPISYKCVCVLKKSNSTNNISHLPLFPCTFKYHIFILVTFWMWYWMWDEGRGEMINCYMEWLSFWHKASGCYVMWKHRIFERSKSFHLSNIAFTTIQNSSYATATATLSPHHAFTAYPQAETWKMKYPTYKNQFFWITVLINKMIWKYMI